MKIKNEDIFVYFGKDEYSESNKQIPEPTKLGKKQFFKKQSCGINPEKPDEYYEFLMRGKWGFDFISSELKKDYFGGYWRGWLGLWSEWKGNRKYLRRLCKWCNNIPDWIDNEDGVYYKTLRIIKKEGKRKYEWTEHKLFNELDTYMEYEIL